MFKTIHFRPSIKTQEKITLYLRYFLANKLTRPIWYLWSIWVSYIWNSSYRGNFISQQKKIEIERLSAVSVPEVVFDFACFKNG